ncbi:ABC transporter permease subunit [Bombilactobacillus folatiphilus]|uniref:ABC transporter permease subunit n=1 Tax=Bombilactobacillus folatiphilus TaxID=2923362 RepID=A0ABY4P7G3_9LACO|nr:ABC transporter permease subunit [Bombilactobacillus folatiphilus]UQS81555.1 ABC transporter permease subunit [Bombilactobacillus folatiphilus]
MNKNRVVTIMNKELLEIKKDKATLTSLFIIPIIFSIILPLLIIIGGTRNALIQNVSGINQFLGNLSVKFLPNNISHSQIGTYALFIYFFIPLFLLIPIIVSTVIASTSFVGEKENKTLEGLLYTPVTDSELILGKIMAAAIPSVFITWGSILIYGIILDTVGLTIFGRVIFPNAVWITVGFVLVPVITFLSILLVIMVSQRVSSSKSAQSVSMVLILPLIGLIISQASGLLIFNVLVTLLLAFILVIIDFVIFKIVVKKFNREKITLNL